MEQPVYDVRTFAQRFARSLMRATGLGRELDIRGKRYRVHHERLISVVQINVLAADETVDYSTRFVAPEDLLIEHVTARSSDADGLEGFRIGWTNNKDSVEHFIKPNENDTRVFPVAGTLVTDAGTPRAGQDPWDVAVLKNEKRTFVARYASGAAPFVVELTLHMRRLVMVTTKK